MRGKSILPLTVSCGCTVTGLMATRTIERIDERKMTIFLVPFMPCGAKMAVFSWFSYVFFDGNPKVKTFKRYGWVVENDKDLPFLIHCSWNLAHVQKDAFNPCSGNG